MTALRLENHRLVADPGHPIEIVDKCDEVSRARGWRPTIRPWLFVPHYAVTHSLDATYRVQVLRGFYAHASIDGYKSHAQHSTMKLIQQVPFNVRASHAGESSWKGLDQCNDFAIGVEIANPGPLVRGSDGKLRTVYDKVWPEEDAEEHPVPTGYPKSWTHWAKYSDEELGILVALALLLKAEGLLTDIAGHSEIAPGRKFDPGPAFPMTWFRQMVLPEISDTDRAPPLEA